MWSSPDHGRLVIIDIMTTNNAKIYSLQLFIAEIDEWYSNIYEKCKEITFTRDLLNLDSILCMWMVGNWSSHFHLTGLFYDSKINLCVFIGRWRRSHLFLVTITSYNCIYIAMDGDLLNSTELIDGGGYHSKL